MQTEDFKWCGIDSCDVNNPFLTFDCWLCVSNGNGFFSSESEGVPSVPDKLLQLEHILEQIHMRGMHWTDARAPHSQSSWLQASWHILKLLSCLQGCDCSFGAGYGRGHRFLSSSLCGSCTPFPYPHCCSGQLGHKIQKISSLYKNSLISNGYRHRNPQCCSCASPMANMGLNYGCITGS